MAGAKIIKQLLAERDINVNELAETLGIKAQSMSNKLYRDSFSFEEMCIICNILNADLKAITRDSQKEFYEIIEAKHEK
ncbi:MAG: helix-turn-helix transcriptional regulator [Eubacteriales bacterium]|nr:helix-turn-helix transcriptional regulator [Eubacteriales bacterium]